VKCPVHFRCGKYRNTGAAQQLDFGRQGPIAFLACWLSVVKGLCFSGFGNSAAAAGNLRGFLWTFVVPRYASFGDASLRFRERGRIEV
jgi:hypothetical protein